MAIAFSSASGDDIDLDLIRHVTLDAIARINSKFKRQYGSPVFAIDSKQGSWRREVFPYYKATRAAERKKSTINWTELIAYINSVKLELIEHFPYKVIEVPRAEADDIIGVLTTKSVAENEPVMIISGDKDFIQLQIDNNLVQQWDRRSESYIGSENPKRYMFEHILKGDRGDGIPNVLSSGDCLVTGVRQKPMRAAKIEEWWSNPTLLREQSDEFKERLEMNKLIIALRNTPKDLQEQILSSYESYEPNHKSNLHQYFIDKRMKKLYESIKDF